MLLAQRGDHCTNSPSHITFTSPGLPVLQKQRPRKLPTIFSGISFPIRAGPSMITTTNYSAIRNCCHWIQVSPLVLPPLLELLPYAITTDAFQRAHFRFLVEP